MTSIELTFVNSQGGILILQVDPWANLERFQVACSVASRIATIAWIEVALLASC
jgi:hypothetical protein